MSSETIGSYHLGEYFTETTFNHASLLYTEFQSSLELVNGLTAYHENIHFLQDIGTGFGCFHSEMIRSRNEIILFKLREWDKSKIMKIPFNKFTLETSNSINKKIIENCQSFYNDYNYSIDRFFNKEFLAMILLNFKIPPRDKNWIHNASKIGINELYEGITTLFSHYFCTYFGKEEYRDFYRYRIDYLPEIYITPLKYLSQTLFPFYEKISIDKKLDLLFIISDLSLHIPPPDIINSIYNDSKELALLNFIPGWRFFHAINAIIDLDLEFPEISKEGYTEFVNKICNHPDLNWLTMETTTDIWIKFLENQSILAWNDSSIKWKIAMMKRRKETPHLFSSFWNIHETVSIEMGKIPFVGKTKASNWVYIEGEGSNFKLSDVLADTKKIILQKVFLNSAIFQIMRDGILTCPFPKGLASCDKERKECNSGINTCGNYYLKDCLYSHWLELFFHLPLNILQPIEVKKRDLPEVEDKESMEEIMQNLFNITVSDDFEKLLNEIKKLKDNSLYKFLKQADEGDERLLPPLIPEFFEHDIPKGAKTFVIDGRWNQAWALYNSGLSFVDRGDTNNAIVYFKEMTEAYPNFWQGWFNLGVQLNRLGKDIDAFKIYGEALKRNPVNYEIWSNLGFSLAKIEKWRKAIIFLEEAIELNPNDYITLNTLGICERQIDNFDACIEYLKKAIQINPERSEAWINLHAALKQSGNDKEAAEVYVKLKEFE